MRRLIILAMAVGLLMTVSVGMATAKPAEKASGDWTYVPDLGGLTSRTAGNTTFVYGTEVSTFTGTFEGTSTDDFVVVCHQKAPDSFMNFVKITIDFTGEVDGRVGGLTMKATGKQDSTTCDPSGAIWSGKWVIVGGTGDLVDLHGHGTWTGPSFDLDYTGKIHFN